MKIRLHEEYYHWCCDWCDSDNRVLWARLGEEVRCGACHRELLMAGASRELPHSGIAAGLC